MSSSIYVVATHHFVPEPRMSLSVLSRNENSSTCHLTVVPMAGGKQLFVCHLNQIPMFAQLDVQVHREGIQIYNRSLLVELVCK